MVEDGSTIASMLSIDAEPVRAAESGASRPLWLTTEAGLPEWVASQTTEIADLGNVSTSSFAGSITAALFLKRFVTVARAWLHLDIYAWNAKERPGRPVGAEAQCVRALYRLIRARFG